MKKLLLALALLLLASPADAQFSQREINMLKKVAEFLVLNGISGFAPEVTVANLPVSPPIGTMRTVTDGLTASDCNEGLGSEKHVCFYDGDNWGAISGGISSETDTLDTTFGRGKVIGGANSSTNAVQICDDDVPTNCWRIYHDPTSGFIIDTNPAANARQRIPTDKDGGFFDVENNCDILVIDPDAANPKAAWTFTCTATKPRKSIWFGAESLYGDGTQCPTDPTSVTINSGPIITTFICTENDASTLHGAVRMPDSWDGGTVTFTHVYIQTAADTGSMFGDIACQVRAPGEAPSSTYGTEAAIDDAAVTGSNAADQTTSAAVTCAGTTLSGGDTLYFRWQYDAAALPTTAAATLHHVGFNLEYSISSLSD